MSTQKQTQVKYSKLIKLLSVVTLIGLFVINIIGFVDTETGSTFGCGHDWPLCGGQLIPSKWGLHTLIEFSHRAIVGFTTTLLLILSFWTIKRYRRKDIILLNIISVGFVFVQAFLGAMAVFFTNPPSVIALHFGFSLLAFSGVLLLTIVVFKLEKFKDFDMTISKKVGQNSFGKWYWFTFIYMYAAIYFGAYISSIGAGVTFSGWPFPTESLDKQFTVLDYAHRLAALILVILIGNIFFRTKKIRKEYPELYKSSIITLILVFAQAFSGAYVIYSHVSLTGFLLHVSIMTFLFSSLSYLGFLIHPMDSKKIKKEKIEQIKM